MNDGVDGICSKCKFVVEAYEGTWQYCNKYLCKTSEVKTCTVDHPENVPYRNPP